MAEMEEHVRRAEDLAPAVVTRFASEGLAFEYELQPYDGGCMVQVDLLGDDGFIFSVARMDPFGWIEILDPGDYRLPRCRTMHFSGRVELGPLTLGTRP